MSSTSSTTTGSATAGKRQFAHLHSVSSSVLSQSPNSSTVSLSELATTPSNVVSHSPSASPALSSATPATANHTNSTNSAASRGTPASVASMNSFHFTPKRDRTHLFPERERELSVPHAAIQAAYVIANANANAAANAAGTTTTQGAAGVNAAVGTESPASASNGHGARFRVRPPRMSSNDEQQRASVPAMIAGNMTPPPSLLNDAASASFKSSVTNPTPSNVRRVGSGDIRRNSMRSSSASESSRPSVSASADSISFSKLSASSSSSSASRRDKSEKKSSSAKESPKVGYSTLQPNQALRKSPPAYGRRAERRKDLDVNTAPVPLGATLTSSISSPPILAPSSVNSANGSHTQLQSQPQTQPRHAPSQSNIGPFPPVHPAAQRGSAILAQANRFNWLDHDDHSKAVAQNNKMAGKKHIPGALTAPPNMAAIMAAAQNAGGLSLLTPSSSSSASQSSAVPSPASSGVVLEVGVDEDANLYHRNSMEDAYLVKLGFKAELGGNSGSGSSNGNTTNGSKRGSTLRPATQRPARSSEADVLPVRSAQQSKSAMTGAVDGLTAGSDTESLSRASSTTLSSSSSTSALSLGSGGASSSASLSASSVASSDALFAIFDGHGGRNAVDHVSQHFTDYVVAAAANSSTCAAALDSAFLQIDESMASNDDFQHTGCTAVVGWLHFSNNGKTRKLNVANVGDAQAVLVVLPNAGQLLPHHSASTEEKQKSGGDASNGSDEDNDMGWLRGPSKVQSKCKPMELVVNDNGTVGALPLCSIHVATDKDEQRRVRESGGTVLFGRVGGSLAVSRALGDHALKSCGVSAKPYTSEVLLTSQHKYLVLACDGIFDTMTPLQAAESVSGYHAKGMSAQDMAAALVQLALNRGTTDNVTAMVIRLHQ